MKHPYFYIVLLVAFQFTTQAKTMEQQFYDDQCQHFRNALYSYGPVANRGDRQAQIRIALQAMACVPTGFECIDKPMPGKVMKCRPIHLETEE